MEQNCQIELKWLLYLVSVYISGTNGWNATKFAWISLGKDKEFIMFDDMHSIFKVTAGHVMVIKLATIEWFGWWGTSVFSEINGQITKK